MHLYIGDNFSDDPAGRFYTDGDGSGEEFREEVLLPILQKTDESSVLYINIDKNVEGYGSSFLVEAFGGLVKYGYFDSKYLKKRICIECKDHDYFFYKDKIYNYIEESKYDSEKYSSTIDKAIALGVYKKVIDKSFVSSIIQKGNNGD